MNKLLRPKCWITRHHWLLQSQTTKTIYADNNKPRDEIYHYQCQVCGKWSRQTVINLDNHPYQPDSLIGGEQ